MGMVLALAVSGCASSPRAEEAQPRNGSGLPWQREDIAVFRDEFLAVDRAFGPEARKQAERRLAELERQATDPTAFAVELCRIAALADNGHTQCLPNGAGRDICRSVAEMPIDRRLWCRPRTPDFEIQDFNGVPIAFFPFDRDFNVVGVEEGNADLLGARLVAIEGKPIESIVPTLRTFAGGTAAHRDERAAQVLSSPDQLHAVGLTRQADKVGYTFLAADGQQIVRVFPVRSSSSPGAGAWRGLPRVEHGAWAFQQPEKPFRYRDAPEVDGVIVQLRRTFDDGDRKLADFLEEAETQRQTLGRKHVVLDMRFNGGGNFLLIRDFMRRWPARAPGRFFVLTSRQTFSAAIASIAYLKQAGKERVTIVGEPVGDRMMFFSDGLPIRLPRSGRYFLAAVARMDYADGCRKYDDCMEAIAQPGRPVASGALMSLGAMPRLPVSVPTLEPDMPAPWTIDAWLKGEDPMMDAVATSLRK
ncbi:hypothetical protein FCE95_15240 [Luteimonas gilva]|uniref:Peptidase S41 n=1 Tax=Luteimonas gilva TaxID=2572684 RepID=A0A4U5JLU2_9GAMM|nr:hypothetical protein [Luteimonas gilva]TKR29491.1 hypothetical protein FCE95_15240 [Luteimonas gilva]